MAAATFKDPRHNVTYLAEQAKKNSEVSQRLAQQIEKYLPFEIFF